MPANTYSGFTLQFYLSASTAMEVDEDDDDDEDPDSFDSTTDNPSSTMISTTDDETVTPSEPSTTPEGERIRKNSDSVLKVLERTDLRLTRNQARNFTCKRVQITMMAYVQMCNIKQRCNHEISQMFGVLSKICSGFCQRAFIHKVR